MSLHSCINFPSSPVCLFSFFLSPSLKSSLLFLSSLLPQPPLPCHHSPPPSPPLPPPPCFSFSLHHPSLRSPPSSPPSFTPVSFSPPHRANDSGLLTHKETLPVRSLVLGDLQRPGSEAAYRVGPLRCHGDSRSIAVCWGTPVSPPRRQ